MKLTTMEIEIEIVIGVEIDFDFELVDLAVFDRLCVFSYQPGCRIQNQVAL